ncbi:MAG: hypothetical protein ABI171_10455 [Collimonas sp.]|uniref:hypothetical protein n=1 Tax=Collimonas sp. TaxID=1963772 RepID=UPI003262D9CE
MMTEKLYLSVTKATNQRCGLNSYPVGEHPSRDAMMPAGQKRKQSVNDSAKQKGLPRESPFVHLHSVPARRANQ